MGATPGRDVETALDNVGTPDLFVRRLPVSRLNANCYIVTCAATGATIIIDAGDEYERVLTALDEVTGGERDRLRMIVSTHGHADHTAAVSDLRAVLGPVPVVMHALDVELVEGNSSDAHQYMRRAYVPVLPDRLVADGDTIAFGTCTLRVIHTPGHSPGGVCLYGHGVVFSGDSLFRGGVGNWSYFKGNRDDLLRTVKTGVLSLPPATRVLPGHGDPTTVGQELATNPYFAKQGLPRGRRPGKG